MEIQPNKPQVPAWIEFIFDKLVMILLILLENWLIIFIFCMAFGQLSSCKSKPQNPPQSVPITLPVDSVRLQLEREVQWSTSKGMATTKENSKSAVTDYEKAKEKFDKSSVTLP
ncbi:hypothetical protein G8759_20045 [Spirosoma aureum]|uniref:Uncharacterized protein n=1 Tax=Spirosoma aureum TaxID=2692134 RepID=A0A6G9AQY6_9BACT|nr:hypothetical protein [Spirosoma aureum]QIP14744.1 hypothetical protein G8759_20045 [Spirosoma aureum]